MAAGFKSGATALITGGASGIGFAFAKICRSTYGMNVALLDKNEEHLAKAKTILSSLSKNNEKTETFVIDVSQLDEWKKVKSDFESKFDSLDFLMLNAGTSFKAKDDKPWEDPEYHHKTYNVNMFGIINGLATFLKTVQANSSPSTIVITGSKQGITNPPGTNPAYNASKAAVKHLAEHLSHDMKKASPELKVHLLVPGWVYTGLSGNPGPIDDEVASKNKPNGAWLPSTTAEYAMKHIKNDKFYIVCPDDDVSEALDQARMTWGAEDVVEGRPALSRWDAKTKDEAAEWIKKEAARRSS